MANCKDCAGKTTDRQNSKDADGQIAVRDALWVTRSIWNGREGKPKTGKSRAPVPVIKQLAERLELHRLRSGSPQSGPIFANRAGRAMALTSVVNRIILPTLNKCVTCRKTEIEHRLHRAKFEHQYVRDASLPEWHGWHAARRGLGSNLYHLGVSPAVIQAILRHSNASTTMTYYVKPLAQDVSEGMTRLEEKVEEKFEAKTAIQNSQDTNRTVNQPTAARSVAIQ
jgi:integrase